MRQLDTLFLIADNTKQDREMEEGRVCYGLSHVCKGEKI